MNIRPALAGTASRIMEAMTVERLTLAEAASLIVPIDRYADFRREAKRAIVRLLRLRPDLRARFSPQSRA